MYKSWMHTPPLAAFSWEAATSGKLADCLGEKVFQGLRRWEISDLARIHRQPQARAG